MALVFENLDHRLAVLVQSDGSTKPVIEPPAEEVVFDLSDVRLNVAGMSLYLDDKQITAS